MQFRKPKPLSTRDVDETIRLKRVEILLKVAEKAIDDLGVAIDLSGKKLQELHRVHDEAEALVQQVRAAVNDLRGLGGDSEQGSSDSGAR